MNTFIEKELTTFSGNTFSSPEGAREYIRGMLDRATLAERARILDKIEDRRCPPGGVTDIGRAIVEGFNRALDYIKEDVEAPTKPL